MDGNQRYTKRSGLTKGDGHKVGFATLMLMLHYCYELEVKYVTAFAFSIDNFKRQAEEVHSLMELLKEKIEWVIEHESEFSHSGVRVYFIGNLKLLPKPVRVAAQRAVDTTARNSKLVLSICVAYTSTDEILHSVQECCGEKLDKFGGNELGQGQDLIGVFDVERQMYMAVAPDPDIIIRTSGKTRLSNFLFWRSSNCLLYSPHMLWPEFGFWHLVRAVLEFQRKFCYMSKQKQA